MRVSFTVTARAYPQGSKRHVGRGRLVEQAGLPLRQYRAKVALHADSVCSTPTTKPVSVRLVFAFTRPKAHYTSKGVLKASAPLVPYPAKRGDVDKLCRSTLDALTGHVFVDDAQVVHLEAVVTYAQRDSVTIVVTEPPKTASAQWFGNDAGNSVSMLKRCV